MCDLFLSRDALGILKNRRFLFLGDSNVRAYYKDMVYLAERNKLIPQSAMKNKLSSVVPNDKLIRGTHLHRGRDYYEVRQYENNDVFVEFNFMTRCYTRELEDLFAFFKREKKYPNVVVMNSCLWDISRWGPNGVLDYKDNMVKLMLLLRRHLPKDSLFIWLTVPPVSNKCKGGLLVKQVQFLEHSLRFDVMEGNMFARELVVSYGYDVLDIHYYLRMQIHRRANDGIHWQPTAIRHVTNMILTHICVAYGIQLPGNVTGESLRRFMRLAVEKKKEPQLPKVLDVPLYQNPKLSKLKKTTVTSAASPLRKYVKEKVERSRRKLDLGDEEVSVLEISTDNHLDASLNEDSFRDLNLSFEDEAWDLQDMHVSALPNYHDEEQSEFQGPVRMRSVMRKRRINKRPYTYLSKN